MDTPSNIIEILDKHWIVLDASSIFSGNIDPNEVPVQAPNGSVYFNEDDQKMYVKTENGWQQIQSPITQA